MNRFLLAVIILSSLNCFANTELTIPNSVFDNSKLEFIEKKGEGRFSNYLAMQINFAPIAELFKEILINKRFPLTSRGEAHITVIPPTEYSNILKERVSIDEINQIAQRLKIQVSKFSITCLGMGESEIDSKLEKTFYIVVESSDLLKIREEVQRLFISRGGKKDDFNINSFYPHITIGFTKRDLHEEDGVLKGRKSCHQGLKVRI